MSIDFNLRVYFFTDLRFKKKNCLLFSTFSHGGFRIVPWNAPKDLRTAVEDIFAFWCLHKRHRDLSQGATAQLVVSVVQPHSCAQPAPSARFSNSTAGYGSLPPPQRVQLPVLRNFSSFRAVFFSKFDAYGCA